MKASPPRTPPPPPAAPAEPAGGTAPAPSSEAAARRMLEARLARLENYLGFSPLQESEVEQVLSGAQAVEPESQPLATDEGIEMAIGEYWLARVGILALSVGLAFLVAYPFAGMPAIASCLIGYAAAAGFFAAAHRWRSALPDTARILYTGALFLLYFATLRLHFFSAHAVLGGMAAGLGALALVLGAEFYLTVRRGSEIMSGLVFLLGAATAVISDTAWVEPALLAILAATAVGIAWRRNWPWFGLAATALTLLLNLDWLLGHPLLGRAPHGAEASQGNLYSLACSAALFAALGCRPRASDDNLVLAIGRPVVISGAAMLAVLLNVRLFYMAAAPWAESLAGAGLLVAAFAHWRRQQTPFAVSIYACAGYLMLSFAIFRYFPEPYFYAWLAWQSLLVVATAIWFRSKLIIVANLFIFGGIYIAYLVLGTVAGPVNLSFAAVALLTARILNWQKDNLSLRTEAMRNTYLGAASIVIPYGLYHTVPKAWVSLSWLVAAGLYFVASAMLASRKYRWMGIGTILATIVYVFVVDLARLEPAYRIMSFLILGGVLLGISIVYTRQHRRQQKETAQE